MQLRMSVTSHSEGTILWIMLWDAHYLPTAYSLNMIRNSGKSRRYLPVSIPTSDSLTMLVCVAWHAGEGVEQVNLTLCNGSVTT